jgi:hypothetical protein
MGISPLKGNLSVSSNTIQDWLAKPENKRYVAVLFDEINQRRIGFQSAALAKGDTDYEKGQVDALLWAARLPERIFNETSQESTGADT